MDDRKGLYIHIPFCVKKCDYCDFLSFGGCNADEIDIYIEALCQEIANTKEVLSAKKLSTIYIGGGTPSLLSEDQFQHLMDVVYEHYELREGGEFTIELNPGTFNEKKVDLYKSYGINRVSMGLQSTNDEMLETLGRIHGYKQFEEAYFMLMEKGISNISVDVMFGLPDQSMADWLKTLYKVLALKPNHISAYSLIIEPDTPFEERYEAGQLNLPDEDTEREMFWKTHEILTASGYHHYEISNYSKPSWEALHNSSYWEMIPYIGVGLGASSYYNKARYKNIIDLNAYIEARGAMTCIREKEQDNTPEVDIEEAFFLGLRKLDGIDLEAFSNRYGTELVGKYYRVIDQLIEEKLLIAKGVFMLPYKNGIKPMAKDIRLSHKGIDISNQVMARFI